MQVSNDKLAELIADCDEGLSECDDLLHFLSQLVFEEAREGLEDLKRALLELQSLRSAAEAAGAISVDEHAMRMERAICDWEEGEFNIDRMGIIVDELTALLAGERAKYVALLEECRNVVWGEATNARMHSDLQGADQLVDLLNRIDALKGGT